MKLTDHLKDKIYLFIIEAVALTVAVIFLAAFKVRWEVFTALAVVFLLACVTAELYDLSRKKKFYDFLYNALDGLDKKYLLTEMLPEADFLEGELLKDVLLSCSKSMAENVAFYRIRNKEFREYIEMWVHEAKLPVATLELICRNNPDIKDRISGQLKKLDEYIENVLYYARSENADKDYIIKETPLNRAFANAAVKNREALLANGAELETQGLDITVLTDGKWLEFIFGQLISNSLKYKAEDRPLKISVTAEPHEDSVVLLFKDNGSGIPAEDLPYVFEKSFTGANGHRHPGSTGMGLYIVKSLCNRLGHSLTVRSEQGAFTEFIFTFSKNNHLKMS
jgi:signal transduction histidine kinase